MIGAWVAKLDIARVDIALNQVPPLISAIRSNVGRSYRVFASEILVTLAFQVLARWCRDIPALRLPRFSDKKSSVFDCQRAMLDLPLEDVEALVYLWPLVMISDLFDLAHAVLAEADN